MQLAQLALQLGNFVLTVIFVPKFLRLLAPLEDGGCKRGPVDLQRLLGGGGHDGGGGGCLSAWKRTTVFALGLRRYCGTTARLRPPPPAAAGRDGIPADLLLLADPLLTHLPF